jgi:protein-S-isoprenylcysteine O-methyltransferase Ste14
MSHNRSAAILLLIIQLALFAWAMRLAGCGSIAEASDRLVTDEPLGMALSNAVAGLFFWLLAYDLVAVWRFRRGQDASLNLLEWKGENAAPDEPPASGRSRLLAYPFLISVYVLTMAWAAHSVCS